jgi:hypothetical protein
MIGISGMSGMRGLLARFSALLRNSRRPECKGCEREGQGCPALLGLPKRSDGVPGIVLREARWAEEMPQALASLY